MFLLSTLQKQQTWLNSNQSAVLQYVLKMSAICNTNGTDLNPPSKDILAEVVADLKEILGVEYSPYPTPFPSPSLPSLPLP